VKRNIAGHRSTYRFRSVIQLTLDSYHIANKILTISDPQICTLSLV
jgi:hypothetical protein